MKLTKVERGASVTSKLKLVGIRALALGTRPPDVVRVLIYRPELFGKHVNSYFEALLRGPSEWTVGERELFAAMVSRANGCRFCTVCHSAVAARVLGTATVEAALSDWRNAPVSLGMRATLGFLEKLSKDPISITHADIDAVLVAGVSKDALRAAIHICTVFCMINRIADSLGFEVPPASAFARIATILLKQGYEL